MSFVTDELKTKQEELDPKVEIPFYHGCLSSDVAEERLESHGKEGGYIFRESDTKTGVFILSSITDGSVSHSNSTEWKKVADIEDFVNLVGDFRFSLPRDI